MNLQRGLLRLGIASVTVWFVFWTFAYVIHPITSLRPEPSFANRVTGWSVVMPCLIATVILGTWVAAGLRSDAGSRLTRRW
jgi:hypothetical protein